MTERRPLTVSMKNPSIKWVEERAKESQTNKSAVVDIAVSFFIKNFSEDYFRSMVGEYNASTKNSPWRRTFKS